MFLEYYTVVIVKILYDFKELFFCMFLYAPKLVVYYELSMDDGIPQILSTIFLPVILIAGIKAENSDTKSNNIISNYC